MRVAIMGGIALIVFAVLFLRLWSLQVLAGTKYRREALDNQLRTVSLEAPRGAILDSQGRLLVTNVISKAVVVWPADLPPRGAVRAAELKKLSEVLGIPIRRIRKQVREHSDIVSPVTVQVAVHPEQVQYIYEHASEFPGVQIKPTYLRYYNSEGLLAQTLGYVGRITPEEYKQLRRSPERYQPDDRIGQAGVESAYDAYLHGTNGTAQLRVDSSGRPTSPLVRSSVSQAGYAVRLTVDIGLQRAAEKALDYGISLAHSTKDGWGADGGAVVALDPNTGAVLAMASSPSYKPSVWVNRDSRRLKPLLDAGAAKDANYPILNRTVDVKYPPGSTFKPVTALAALMEHVVQPYQPLLCSPDYTVKTPYGEPQTFKNWNPYVSSWMTMPTAIAQSCDTYFYQLGWDFYNLAAARGHPLQRWANAFGFGESTGIDVSPEATGLVPTPEWRQKTFTNAIDRLWKPGDSIQLTIGQKDVEVTPMQMARFYALIANGGKLVKPHVVADVEVTSPGGKGAPIVRQSFQPPAPKPSGVDPTALQVVRDGLFLATHDPLGTSALTFAKFPVSVAGKTGTAEKVVQPPGQSDHLLLNQAWWCGYAPADSPTIALCVVIENGGHGGASAAPAAAQILARYFKVKAQQSAAAGSD